jgi:hypothetical protein
MRCLGIRRYPRRPEGLRGIGRIDSLGSFSESAPAALLASFFSVRAGNVSFLKRDPHGRANRRRKSENVNFEYHFQEVSRLIKLAAPAASGGAG